MSEKNSSALPQTFRVTQHGVNVFSEEPIAKGGLTALEYAAIHLRVEHPDLPPWLNEMIRESRRDGFAKAAIGGMWASIPANAEPQISGITENAFKQADAMVAEEEKK